MQLIVGTDAADTAQRAAESLAALIEDAQRLRGSASIALSGGETPWLMLRALRKIDLPWRNLYVAQVDERVVADDHALRNLRRVRELLVDEGPLPAQCLLPMPVTNADIEQAALAYQALIEHTVGRPIVFDVVQLGLGEDGHTASLFPGDAALEAVDRDVAVSGEYLGARRMTLTLPALNRARHRLWLVTGAKKAPRLRGLLQHTGTTPSVRVSQEQTSVYADSAAIAV